MIPYEDPRSLFTKCVCACACGCVCVFWGDLCQTSGFRLIQLIQKLNIVPLQGPIRVASNETVNTTGGID